MLVRKKKYHYWIGLLKLSYIFQVTSCDYGLHQEQEILVSCFFLISRFLARNGGQETRNRFSSFLHNLGQILGLFDDFSKYNMMMIINS